MISIFPVGEHAVFPAQGVTRVEHIDVLDLSGHPVSFYVLLCLESEKRIRVPVAQAAQLGLRPLLAPSDVGPVLAILRGGAAIEATDPHHRYRLLVEKIHGGDPREVALVLRDLHETRRRRPLSLGERQLDQLALRLLVEELAQVRAADLEATTAEVEAMLG